MTAHDPRLAALLAGVPQEAVAAAPGLARLLISLITPPQAEASPASGTPYVDTLLEQVRADAEAAGFAAGEVAGRAAAHRDLAPLRAALADAAAAASAATHIDEARLAPMLADLVKAVAQAVLMAELTTGGRVLQPLVAAALAEVAEAALLSLSAHPDTLGLIAADLPPGLMTITDPALPVGHITVAGPDFRVEAGLADRLARLVEAMAWA